MPTWLRKLAWSFGRRRKEAELREELDFHLAEEAARQRAAGLTEEQARAHARRDLGNVTLVVEDTRAAWGWRTLEQFLQDIRYAARTLGRAPTVTLGAVLTLCIGIGPTTAIFSIVYGILLRPLPLTEPARLVALHTRMSNGQSEPALSPPNFMTLQEETRREVMAVAGYLVWGTTLTGAGEARRVVGSRVSTEFFDVLVARAVVGRTFLREENEPGRDHVVVIGHALWQQQFAGQHDVIGRAIQLDGVAHQVVGVMAPGFEFPSASELWVPQPYGRNYFSSVASAGRMNNAFVRVFGRLGTGANIEGAQEELDRFGRGLQERFRETNAGVAFTAIPLHEELTGDTRTLLLLLFGAVGCVLVIATANVAGLLLARGAGRRAEMAIRGALGAGRTRLVRQLVTESVLLGAAGGLLGLLVAHGLIDWFVVARYEDLRRNGLAEAIRLDGIVVAFAAGTTLLAGVFAGLLPALRSADVGITSALQSAGRSGSQGSSGQRLRSGLVVGQLALAVVLVSGAGVMLHSVIRLMAVDPGFRVADMLSFNIDLPASEYTSNARVRGFFDEVLDGIAARPGIASVAAISRLPIGHAGRFMSRFRLENGVPGEQEPSIGVRVVSPAYFRTMQIPMLRGRGFDDGDRPTSPPVIVINEAAAAQFFPNVDPIGRRLAGFSYDPIEASADTFTIVGIVADVRTRGLGEAPFPEAFFAHAQVSLPTMNVVVRTAGDPLHHVSVVRGEVLARDPNVPIANLRTMEQVLSESLARPRVVATLLGMLATVALALAAVGIFGLLSFAVERRRREIGIRIALGASPTTLVGTVARQALTLVGIGLTLGLGGALALNRALASELFDVTPTDPVTLLGVALVLGATALSASLLPAWRAAAVDPLVALRSE